MSRTLTEQGGEVLKMVLVALIVSVLSFSASQCGPPRVHGPEITTSNKESTEKRSSLILSNRNSTGAFPIETNLPKAETDVLELTVSRVVNPAMTPVSISAYFATAKGQPGSGSEKITVGSFTLYPPDRPGKFLLPASTVWRAAPKAAKGDKPRLVVKLERVDATQPWTNVEVEILSPEFRSAEK